MAENNNGANARERAPKFDYEDVDVSFIEPRKRDYLEEKGGEIMSGNTAQRLNLSSLVRIDPDSNPYQEEFEIPYRPNMNVISAL